jgi:pimeloyl-ACP methyl ester carboxylesterase
MNTIIDENAATTRYRAAEANLWNHYGKLPTERFIELPALGTRVRVQELGEGPPTLFIHGGPNAGSAFASLVSAIPSRKHLVLDRPGCGLSGPVDYDAMPIPELAVAVVAATLDRLEVAQADLVASSFGGSWAMWFARAHPDRVSRLVLLGAPAFVPDMAVPGFVKMMQMPVLGSLIARMPPSVGGTKWVYRQMGHSKRVVEATIPDVYWQWGVRLMADTPTQSNDSEAMARFITRRGSQADVEFTPDQLRSIEAPTLLYWGDADSFGGAGVARAAADLIPRTTLEIVPGAGHLPWLDGPDLAATAVREFLDGEANEKQTEWRSQQPLIPGHVDASTQGRQDTANK